MADEPEKEQVEAEEPSLRDTIVAASADLSPNRSLKRPP